ncbi:hypothetical protein [Myxacorys almedinensis]|nr:hypothetical protein [Myxacorys almedinensis]
MGETTRSLPVGDLSAWGTTEFRPFLPYTPMQYPLELTFKFWALAPQISVKNAQGTVVLYVRQKLFKLKEAINVFSDSQRNTLIYDIKADRIIDFSACYHFSDADGKPIGAVKRQGLRSLWRAHYDILDGDAAAFTIQEENPWIKVIDTLFAEVPVVGIFTGYFFNPTYIVSRPNGKTVMRLSKQPTFLSRVFSIQQIDQLSDREEAQVLLSLLMMLLLERNRG